MALATQPQSTVRTPPNPQRLRDQSGRLLPKVFIAYPHNPLPYSEVASDIESYREWYPGEADHVLQERITRARQVHEAQQSAIIKAHMSKVYNLTKFLERSGVAVAYDQLLSDVGSDNVMRWCQEQIEDSDMVILIITDSFNDFLNGEVPPESEQIFVGNYLSNFVHNPRGKVVLPVFLDQPVNTKLLPKCLEMCKLYSILNPLTLGRGDDLDALYALLTNQDRFTPPAPSLVSGPVQVNTRKRRRSKKLWVLV